MTNEDYKGVPDSTLAADKALVASMLASQQGVMK